jgi:hypothetical protein
MSTYYGVVKGNVVVLPEDTELADGLTVEVRVVEPETEKPGRDEREAAFLQHLVEIGLLEEVKTPDRTQVEQDRRLIEVKGKPLSEVIIEERR